VTLKLGGKSPVIIDAGAPIEPVATVLAAAKQFNGDQACVNPDYAFRPFSRARTPTPAA